MKYSIKIEKNPFLQYGAKVAIPDTKIATIEQAMSKFLKEQGVMLNRIAFAWSNEEGQFRVVNNDNGAEIARCTIQIVSAKV